MDEKNKTYQVQGRRLHDCSMSVKSYDAKSVPRV